ncbi:MAG: GtrA family protein [Clostridiales bacterium]|nr:MAG: GtrA family protein [Clostridiales bacterium]
MKAKKLTDWNEYEKTHKKSFLKTFLTPEFMAFLIIGCINVSTGVGFSSLFSIFLPANFAFVFGYAVSLTISYFFKHIFLAFKEKNIVCKIHKILHFVSAEFHNSKYFFVVVFIQSPRHKQIPCIFLLAAILGVPVTFLYLRFFRVCKKRTKK